MNDLMSYLHWNEKTISDFSDTAVTDLYDHGYVFTRIGRGVMHETRSVRIDLSKFEISSENRRVMKKTEDIVISSKNLPLADYDFGLGKMAKDFYSEKFGANVMSAQKIKEMLTDLTKSNFNTLLTYTTKSDEIGYTISYMNSSFLHYSYPFYALQSAPKDMGLGMMTKAINFAKESGLKYIYLGSLQRPTDTYKLQFAGLEWFDGKKWQTDIESVKKILKDGEALATAEV